MSGIVYKSLSAAIVIAALGVVMDKPDAAAQSRMEAATYGARTTDRVQSTGALRLLRSISPDRGQVVRPGSRRLAANGGPQELTCCTHWNTQSGGTGCASYDDSEGSCPSGMFQVDCGPTGCW